MTVFDSFAASLQSAVSGIFGTSAVYTPVAGDAVNCSVNLTVSELIQPDGYDAVFVETVTMIEGFFSEIGEPRIGSTFVVGSDSYTVKRIESNDKQYVKLVVK